MTFNVVDLVVIILRTSIQSSLEYLSIRYNVLTQQIVARTSVLLKVFDLGAKWAAIGILLHVVAGILMTTPIISGVVTSTNHS